MSEASDNLRAWKNAIDEGDLRSAIILHDAVSKHIHMNQDSANVFGEAKMNPQPFVEWARMKTAIREQLAKSREQLEADYVEAVLQLQDATEKLAQAKTIKVVVATIALAHNALRAVMLNAAYLGMPHVESVSAPTEHAATAEDVVRLEEDPTDEEPHTEPAKTKRRKVKAGALTPEPQ